MGPQEIAAQVELERLEVAASIARRELLVQVARHPAFRRDWARCCTLQDQLDRARRALRESGV